jgi:diguanylate cyclase (GGDEF)-like protein/PAS domain S-box-containing protein
MSRNTPVVARVEDVLLRFFYPQRRQLASLAQADHVTDEDLAGALRSLTEAAADALGVERASVWRLQPDRSAIECADLFERTPRRHQAGTVLRAALAPGYFRALATERVIAAHDALRDPRTSEFGASYLEPLGITSMLDAPVFVAGQATAVICHEHVGPARQWEFWEELVATTFAELVATAFEAHARNRDVAARRAQQLQLEQLVAERTAALTESEQNLHVLLDAAPVPLVLSRVSDHRVVYGNARAAAMFELPPDEIVGQLASAFWLEEKERQRFLSTLLAKGRIDDFEVQLRRAKGRPFWARVNAQAVRFRGELTLLAGLLDITDQHQAQQNLRGLFESAPVALVLSRLSDSVVLDANQRAADLFEISIEEARGRPAPDYWVHPEDRAHLRDAVKATGRLHTLEAEVRTHRGKLFWAEVSAALVKSDGEPALIVGASDITVRRKAEEALRRSESALRTLLDAAPTPLVVTRLEDGVLRYCNEPAAAMFELSVEECVGRRAPDFYADPADRRAFIEALRKGGSVAGFSARLRTSSGRPFWALMNAKIFDLEGEAVFMVGFAELTAQKELEERLRTLAITDGLTGAFNRRHFFELGEAELERAERYGRLTSLAMLDIDHFKRINDELGHAAGDAALKELVAVLRKEVRGADIVGRLGGEEFALLFPETRLAAATATAERVRRTIGDHSFEDHGLPAGRRLTVSIGVAERRPKETLGDLLKRADEGLYQAKAGGRDRVVTPA